MLTKGIFFQYEVKCCQNLESLEIDKGMEIDDVFAGSLLEAGLEILKNLYLTHTIIWPSSLVLFHGKGIFLMSPVCCFYIPVN